MNIAWRVLITTLVCALYAGSASAQQFDFAENAGHSRQPAWWADAPDVPPGSSDEIQLAGFDSGLVTAASDCCPIECDDCCLPPWAHRSSIFGELLMLRARDAEVAYAVAIDGAIVPPPASPIQVGPVAVADPDYEPGFRVGGSYALDDCSSIVLTYSRFQSSTNDTVGTTAPLVLRSLVLHPGTANAGSDFLDASATLGVDFDLADIDYRAVWSADELWAVNYVIGARYARLQQDFTGVFTSTGTTDTLDTRLDFEGGGLKFGLDGERHACNSGILAYGKASASFVAGEFRGSYLQGSDVDPVIVDTSWRAGRMVTILDMEVGLGWQSIDGRWRITSGYMISAWYNVVPTNEWIEGVQTNNFVGLNDDAQMITFDGLTARLEYRW